MIGLEIRFLAGRFHANAWHHAHNEGVPEWPPSPWRVLRALVSAAYSRGVPMARAETLIEQLSTLPLYRVPLAVDAHTRHYMPDVERQHEPSRVFDTFVAVDGGAEQPEPVVVAWRNELSSGDRDLLTELCRSVAYLGRAESWAELRVVDVDDGEWNCVPDTDGTGRYPTTLLAPRSPHAIAEWAARQPKPKKGRDVPRTLWDVLTFRGEWFRDEGWSDLPGTARVRYEFRSPPFRRAVLPTTARPSRERPTVACYAIHSAVLPRLENALGVCERLRTAAMSQSRRSSGDARAVFSGHGAVTADHAHARYLAACSGDAAVGCIDRLVVAARQGFDSLDVVALQSIRRLWGDDGHDLDLVLIALGNPADFGGLRRPRIPELATARVWESVTPFVPIRHPKMRRGVEVDSLVDQIRQQCLATVGAVPTDVLPFGERDHWLRFRRRRRHGGGRRGVDRAIGARLVFESPVCGPVALGYGSHFGLGLFAAVE